MSRVSRASMATAVALCFMGASLPSHAAQGDEWEWMVAPYVWAASIGTDLRTGQPPAESDTSFSGIIDKIDGAFLMHAEGQGEQFGMFADYIFLGLEDDKEFTRIRTQSDLDSQLFELAAFWSPGQERFRGLMCSAACVTSTWTSRSGSTPSIRSSPRRSAASTSPTATSCSERVTRGRCPIAGSSRCAATVRSEKPKGRTAPAR